jgi:hypothetical protein
MRARPNGFSLLISFETSQRACTSIELIGLCRFTVDIQIALPYFGLVNGLQEWVVDTEGARSLWVKPVENHSHRHWYDSVMKFREDYCKANTTARTGCKRQKMSETIWSDVAIPDTLSCRSKNPWPCRVDI